MSNDFLSRWSRRKQTHRGGRGPAPHSEAGALAPDEPQQQVDRPGDIAAEPALTPEEIAALPKVDELTADSDIAGFLRRGVPEGLRNAALRKIWMLDPAIRDFVGHARDYAYDWNTPGGAPGHGALEPGDDVASMVRRILGEPDTASAGQRADQIARHRTAAVRTADGRPTAAAHHESTGEERRSGAADGETETSPPGKGVRRTDADG